MALTQIKNGGIDWTTGQIPFPATQNPSSDANTLDDYEEGTWTPTIDASSGGPATYLRQVGIYRKVGQVIHVWFDLIINSPSSLSGQCFIAGLPYNMQLPASFAGYAGSVVYWDSMVTSLVQISILAFSTGTGRLFLYGNTGASGTMAPLDASAMNSSSSRFVGYCPYISTS